MGEVRFLLRGMIAFLVCFVRGVLSLTATLSSSFLSISTFSNHSGWAEECCISQFGFGVMICLCMWPSSHRCTCSAEVRVGCLLVDHTVGVFSERCGFFVPVFRCARV